MSNFERFKVVVYNFLLSQPEFNLASVGVSCYRLEFKKSKEDLNKWLDTLDIRCVPSMISELATKGCKLPKYLLNRNYVIDYNKNNSLDLIKL